MIMELKRQREREGKKECGRFRGTMKEGNTKIERGRNGEKRKIERTVR